MRKTKIIMTIGPASMNLLNELVPKVDAVRMNFSHGTHKSHRKEIRAVRKISDRIPLILDTAGPEIRVVEEFNLSKGLNKSKFETNINFKFKNGDILQIDDGKYSAKIKNGKLMGMQDAVIRKGAKIILKNRGLLLPTITEKDQKDLEFGNKEGVDAIAVSFVKSVDDVLLVNEILSDLGAKDIEVIAKIEHPDALKDINRIAKASNGIMIARGDLAIETPFEKMPIIQKQLLRLCMKIRRPGIVATEVLHSMIEQKTATRAELTDIANAVLDGTDAIMLSGETAIGKYPIEAVNTMSKVIIEAEKKVKAKYKPSNIPEEIAFSAKLIAERLNAQIFCSTRSGRSAKIIAKFRPKVPIYLKTPSKKLNRQLNLIWGIQDGEPKEGFVVHVKHLTENPGVIVEYRGPVLARGEGYGNGSIVGIVGKNIAIMNKNVKKVPKNTKAVIYNGLENEPWVRYCVKEGIPILLLDKSIKKGQRVAIDFEFGLMISCERGSSNEKHFNRKVEKSEFTLSI